MILFKNRLFHITFLVVVCAILASCSAGAPDPVVEKFIYSCQIGNWSNAEAMLSDRGKLTFEQSGKSLQETFWPVLGLASTTGMDISTVKSNMDEIVKISSTQPGTTSADVMVNIRNSVIAGPAADAIKSQIGLDSIDVNVKFKLVKESNRWKVENISILGGDDIKTKWERVAEMSPGTFGR